MSYQLRLADVRPRVLRHWFSCLHRILREMTITTLFVSDSPINFYVIDNAFILSFYRKGLQFPRKMKRGESKMKSQKLMVLASAACLLFGVSGTAMAVDCASGAIEETTVDQIMIDGQSCFVDDVVVLGDVQVLNSEDFTMVSSTVGGSVRVIGGRNAFLVANQVTAGDFTVSNNERAAVLVNIVAGNMGVNNNLKADVKKNGVAINLVCLGNNRLDSFQNQVGGVEDCRRSGINP